MKILLSNDDGYNQPGIRILEEILKDYGDVTVAAPHKNMSACSSALSVHSIVDVKRIDTKHYKIKGTPADCIHIVSRGLMRNLPDIVISGINYGSNLGDDVIYSGTVAAAIEGRFCKYAPFAISITSKKPKYTDDLKEKINFVFNHLFKKKYKNKNIYNINIPDIPFSKIKGIKYTILGNRQISKKPIIIKNKNTISAEIGPVGNSVKSTKNTDFKAIQNKYISITPLTTNMCDSKKIINSIKLKK